MRTPSIRRPVPVVRAPDLDSGANALVASAPRGGDRRVRPLPLLVALVACAAALVLPATARAGEPRLQILGGEHQIAGDAPGIAVDGLAPGEHVTLHAFRAGSFFVKDGATYVSTAATLASDATFTADASGTVRADRQAPASGTYAGVDPQGLLWSATPIGTRARLLAAPDLALLKNHALVIVGLERGGALVATRRFAIQPYADGITFTTIDRPGLVGVFAAPPGARSLPTVIVLHGSEGGSFDEAKRDAGRYASRGFATLALIYFAWPGGGITNVPSSFDDIPVEGVETAREWLAQRPEADVSRLGLAGVSKGSEFALLAAATYPWAKAVVAYVPSSLVWGAFGGSDRAHAADSGFSLHGAQVPFVPYGDYAPVQNGTITLAQRHVRDRAAVPPERVSAATIPIERTNARILLFGSGRDEVWPSLAMSREIVARLRANGKGDAVTLVAFPDAGHYISGTGADDVGYYHDAPDAPGGGSADADGHAASIGWETTLAFLRANL